MLFVKLGPTDLLFPSRADSFVIDARQPAHKMFLILFVLETDTAVEAVGLFAVGSGVDAQESQPLAAGIVGGMVEQATADAQLLMAGIRTRP